MYEVEHDLECRIHRLEDKLLRSINYQEQMDLQAALMTLRMKLQKLRWGKQNVGAF